MLSSLLSNRSARRPALAIALGLAASLAGHSSAQDTKRSLGQAPKVSPDGKTILFASDRAGSMQLFRMSAQGSGVRQLTHDTGGVYSGSWSPSGREVVYESGAELIVISADGSGRRVIGREKGSQGPAWSPDSKSVLYAAGVFPNLHLRVMGTDGSGARDVLPDSGFQYDPSWSPDGKQIAFVRVTRGQGARVYVMNQDGSGVRRLTDGVENEERPEWSRDGRQIAFQSAPRGVKPPQAYIRIVDVQSGASRQLGEHDRPWLDETPSWFPDGKSLAIQSDRDGTWSVYVIGLDGKILKRLTAP